MKLLLDTHYLIWLANDPAQLNRREHELLMDEQVQLLVSVVSFWELRIKWNSYDRSGNRKGALAPQAAFNFTDNFGLEFVPLIIEDCLFDLAPEPDHSDPFDEMLLVHAARLGAKLLTRDRALADHPLAYRFE